METNQPEQDKTARPARSTRTTRVGVVISNKMQKTVVVSVDRLVEHPLYRKTIRKTSKFMAHDATNQCKIGDRVRIESTRPLSKRKRWNVIEVVTAAR